MQNGFAARFRLRAFAITLVVSGFWASSAAASSCQEWLGHVETVFQTLQVEAQAMGSALTSYEKTEGAAKKCAALDQAMDHGQKTKLSAANLNAPCYELSQFCLSQTPEPIRNVCSKLGSITSSLETQMDAVRGEKVKRCQ